MTLPNIVCTLTLMRTWPLSRLTSQLSSCTAAALVTSSAITQGSLSIHPSAASAAARAAASAAPAARADESSAAAAPAIGSARASVAAAMPSRAGALTTLARVVEIPQRRLAGSCVSLADRSTALPRDTDRRERCSQRGSAQRHAVQRPPGESLDCHSAANLEPTEHCGC